MGLPLDGASTLGGWTPLTCVGVTGHNVPGRVKLAAVNKGDQRRRQEATIPTYQLDVSLPTASGDPFPQPEKGPQLSARSKFAATS